MDTISLVIVPHALGASVVLLLGPVVLLRRRRDSVHRVLGATWLVAMVITCLSSFAIHRGGFSWLHALSVWTLASICLGFWAIRRRNVAAHRGNMLGCYLGTVAAFAFAVAIPDRLIPTVLREEPAIIVLTALAVTASVAVWVTVVLRANTRGVTGRKNGGLGPVIKPSELPTLTAPGQ